MFVQQYALLLSSLYNLALSAYWIAFAHFVSEIAFFRTASLKGGALAPCIVASKMLFFPRPCDPPADLLILGSFFISLDVHSEGVLSLRTLAHPFGNPSEIFSLYSSATWLLSS